jgi:hypothetical protein
MSQVVASRASPVKPLVPKGGQWGRSAGFPTVPQVRLENWSTGAPKRHRDKRSFPVPRSLPETSGWRTSRRHSRFCRGVAHTRPQLRNTGFVPRGRITPKPLIWPEFAGDWRIRPAKRPRLRCFGLRAGARCDSSREVPPTSLGRTTPGRRNIRGQTPARETPPGLSAYALPQRRHTPRQSCGDGSETCPRFVPQGASAPPVTAEITILAPPRQ